MPWAWSTFLRHGTNESNVGSQPFKASCHAMLGGYALWPLVFASEGSWDVYSRPCLHWRGNCMFVLDHVLIGKIMGCLVSPRCCFHIIDHVLIGRRMGRLVLGHVVLQGQCDAECSTENAILPTYTSGCWNMKSMVLA